MTVSSSLNRKAYTGDGVTTSFSTSPVVFYDSDELDVYVVTTATGASTTLTENTHYTVSGGSGATGSVSLAGGSSPYGAPSASQTLVIVRTLDLVQEFDPQNNDGSDAGNIETAFDKLTMMAQQNSASVARSLRLADSDVTGASLTVPTPSASKLIGWDSAGAALTNYASATIADSIVPTAFMETLLDDTSAAAARATLGSQPYDIRNGGCACNGTTDDSAALQAAIDAANAAGYGTLYVPSPTAIGTKITWKSNVSVVFAGGAYLKWVGSTSGTCFDTPSNAVMTNCQWSGLTVDTGTSFTGTAFRFHSMNRVWADAITAITTGTTSKAFVLTADSSAGGDDFTKRNIVNCYFGSLRQKGICGTVLETSGTLVGYGGNPDVVTLITIGGLFAEDARVVGLNFINYTDNIQLDGQTRVSLGANNAIGVGVATAGGAGVYDIGIDNLAVDTFGSLTGRIAIKMRSTKGINIEHFYNDPDAEGGRLDVNNTVQSYSINLYRDTEGDIICYKRQETTLGGGFNSTIETTLADDTAMSVDVTGFGTDENIYLNVAVTASDVNSNGIVHCKVRRSSGSPASLLLTTSTTLVANTGVMSGTTGTDTKFTVSAAADGKVYFENRTGASVTFVAAFLGHFTVA